MRSGASLLQPLDHALLAGPVEGHLAGVPNSVLVDDAAVLNDLILGVCHGLHGVFHRSLHFTMFQLGC
jgi:hypothetical protein